MMTPEEKAERKEKIAIAQTIKNEMTYDQKIKFLNTPYKDMPDILKPGMCQNPQMFNFVRITHSNIGSQKETFGARVLHYRKNHGLSQQEFCNLCNEFAKVYDLPATSTHRAQRTRITIRDMNNYENFNISPKIDKMTVIAEAMGLNLDYFAGYGTNNRKSKHEYLASKYRKKAC